MNGKEVCRIHVFNRSAFGYSSYPISRGVPFPPGEIRDPGEIGVVGPNGAPLPVQSRVLQRRRDGSVEWALFEFVVDIEGDRSCDVMLARSHERPMPKRPVAVRQDGHRATLSNGLVTLVLSSEPGPFIRTLTVGLQTVVAEGSASEIVLTAPGGKRFRASRGAYRLVVEPGGAVRQTVRLDGKHVADDGTTLLDYALRFTLWADRPDLMVAHSFCNRELPETGIEIEGLELILDTKQDPVAAKVVHQLHHGRDYFSRKVTIPGDAEVVATSEFDIDNYPAKVKPYQNGHVVLRDFNSLEPDLSIYPWHMLPQVSGRRAPDLQPRALQSVKSWVGWRSDRLTVIPRIKLMAEMHPKSLHVAGSTLTVGLWPRWAGPVILRQGVSRTHEVCFALADRPLTDDEIEERAVRFQLDWDPVEESFDPEYAARCEVLDQHQILPYDPIARPVLEQMMIGVDAPGDGLHYLSLGTQGMWDYGDNGGPGFTNNEHDGHVWMHIINYLRTGFTKFWEYAREHAHHYMEVDWCAWSADPLQCGGLIPHCVNHNEGPCYPSHQWIEGLIAYYYLSGDERIRDLAAGFGDHVLRWIERMPQIVTADGREAGLPMANLAAIYKLTGEEKYIKGAYWIIDHFVRRYMQPDGRLRYPHQGNRDFMMTNYADFSTMSGLWRIYEVTGDESLRPLLVKVFNAHAVITNMDPADYRTMDFDAPWMYYQLTKDESIFTRMWPRTQMLLRTGGNKKNRLRWLKLLADTGRLEGVL